MFAKPTPALVALIAITAALAFVGCGGGGEETTTPPPAGAGSKEAAPGVPTYKGGDNSIQTWGVEGSARERARITAIVRDFLAARASAEWAKACSYLVAEQRLEFARLVGKRDNAGCAKGMGTLTKRVPPSVFEEEALIEDVLSLRVGRGTVFLIYTRRPGGEFYAHALGREGGEWKMLLVAPSVLG